MKSPQAWTQVDVTAFFPEVLPPETITYPWFEFPSCTLGDVRDILSAFSAIPDSSILSTLEPTDIYIELLLALNMDPFL